MLDRVRKTITRYNMLPAGSRVAVAVSGGADSVSLLFALRELAAGFGITLAVAHLNHKLRGEESDADEAFVAALARDLQIPFYRAEVNLSTVPGNLEQAARHARRELFHSLIADQKVDRVATAHTRDDQAETVLFRILRGSGLAGIAGIHPVTADGMIRPLLDVTRAEVEEFLEVRGVRWREDRSNRDLTFTRNRIRHSLLPQLTREWNPQIQASLAQMADLAFEEERRAEQQIARLAARYLHEDIHRDIHRGIEVDISTLAGLPRATARRLVRRALVKVRGDLRGIDFAHVEKVLELACAQKGQGSFSLPGVEVRRSFEWIHLAPARGEKNAAIPAVSITPPGTFRSPDGREIHIAEIRVEKPIGHAIAASPLPRITRENGATLRAVDLDWRRGLKGAKSVGGKLELRGWRAGDRYRPQGQAGDRNVAGMLQQAKVPSWRRPLWPIVTCRGVILWARDFGPAAEFVPGPETDRVLRLSFE